jgi:hypothetical protein
MTNQYFLIEQVGQPSHSSSIIPPSPPQWNMVIHQPAAHTPRTKSNHLRYLRDGEVLFYIQITQQLPFALEPKKLSKGEPTLFYNWHSPFLFGIVDLFNSST